MGCRAVPRSVADYEAAEEERAFMRAVVEGLADLETRRIVYRRDSGTVRIVRVWRSERRLRLSKDEDGVS